MMERRLRISVRELRRIIREADAEAVMMFGPKDRNLARRMVMMDLIASEPEEEFEEKSYED